MDQSELGLGEVQPNKMYQTFLPVLPFLAGLPLVIQSAPAPASKCNREWTKVGCFFDMVFSTPRPLPEQLANARDPGSDVFDGELLRWTSDYADDLHSLACTCAEKARGKGHFYFGLQFYGECWSGDWSQADATQSRNCSMPDDSGLPSPGCDKSSQTECVGRGYANYIYKVNPVQQTQSAVPAAGNENAKNNNEKLQNSEKQAKADKSAKKKPEGKGKDQKKGKGKKKKAKASAEAAPSSPLAAAAPAAAPKERPVGPAASPAVPPVRKQSSKGNKKQRKLKGKGKKKTKGGPPALSVEKSAAAPPVAPPAAPPAPVAPPAAPSAPVSSPVKMASKAAQLSQNRKTGRKQRKRKGEGKKAKRLRGRKNKKGKRKRKGKGK